MSEQTSVKQCTKCGEAKPLGDFPPRPDRPSRVSRCGACRRDDSRANHAKFRDARNAKRRAWYAAGGGDERAAWRATNPHQIWAQNFLARATAYGFTDRLVDTFTRDQVIERYGDACVYCGGGFEELDHHHPVSKGGHHVLDNVRPSCVRCNKLKTDFDPSEWSSRDESPDERRRRLARERARRYRLRAKEGLAIIRVTSHVVTSVSVDAVASVEVHPGGAGS